MRSSRKWRFVKVKRLTSTGKGKWEWTKAKGGKAIGVKVTISLNNKSLRRRDDDVIIIADHVSRHGHSREPYKLHHIVCQHSHRSKVVLERLAWLLVFSLRKSQNSLKCEI